MLKKLLSIGAIAILALGLSVTPTLGDIGIGARFYNVSSLALNLDVSVGPVALTGFRAASRTYLLGSVDLPFIPNISTYLGGGVYFPTIELGDIELDSAKLVGLAGVKIPVGDALEAFFDVLIVKNSGPGATFIPSLGFKVNLIGLVKKISE